MIEITNQIQDQVSVQWSIIDGDWTYMDIYVYTKADYDALTPEQLKERQLAQYQAWRAYCENPTG